MKPNLSFRLLTIALIAALTAVGCKEDPKKIVPDPILIDLQVKNITAGEATLAAKPSDNGATYFFGATTQADFDKFSSEADFLDAELTRINALAQAQQMTATDYLKANAKQGAHDIKLSTTTPTAPHYAYAYTIDAVGKATSNLFKVAFTSGEAPATAPKLELALTAGDIEGLDKNFKMTISGKSTGVVSGKLLLALKSAVDEVLAQGVTIEELINSEENGYPLEADEIAALNGEGGWKYAFMGLDPNTAYTAIVKVTNAVGSTIEQVTGSTLSSAGSNPPALDLSLIRGDKDGNNKNTCLTAIIKSTGAMAGRYGLFSKSSVDAALEQGLTLATLIESNGYAFTSEHISAINSGEGYTINIVELKPNVAYTFIAKIANTEGTNVTSQSAITTTGIGPELNVTVIPGDKDGKNTDVNLLMTIKSAGVLSGRHTIMTKSDFDAQIASGKTPAEILTAKSTTFTTAEIAEINTANGMAQVFTELSSSTAYKHIVEAESENGQSYQFTEALTTDSDAPTSDMTFAFAIEDLSATAATMIITPSNNTDTYYFDYLEVEQYDKLTDAEWIAKLSGDTGIPASSLTMGVGGYDLASFDYLPMIEKTTYYLYAFGYDATTKSATTRVMKHKFTTPAKDAPTTAAYQAWLGEWTVTSTSSEKDGTPITMNIEITEKAKNNSYYINGWGVTTYRTRNITAALKEDGGLRIKNKQDIGQATAGRLTFTGRYYNPATSKYSMAVAPIDALIGALDAGGTTATIVGGTFTVDDGEATVRTVTGMDFYNNKETGTWVSYTSLAQYKESGNGVAPFTLAKVADPSAAKVGARMGNAPYSADYKLHLAKRELIKRAIAFKPTTSAPQTIKYVKPAVVQGIKAQNLIVTDASAARYSVSKTLTK